MPYDLHTHSTYSDGTTAPAELVRKAAKIGLDGISLTDHDTIAGQAEAIAAAKELEFCFIPGVEFTTDFGKLEVHILGYDFDLQSAVLKQKFQAILESRVVRAREMVRRLQKVGVPLEWEEVAALTTSSFVGRAHIFKALQKLLETSPERRHEAYSYLSKDGAAYVPHGEIGTFEAIELLLSAGGVPVLAHPGRMAGDALIRQLVDNGLQGIEVYYPHHAPDLINRYKRLAKKYGLITTGGSDYHGDFRRTPLGEAAAPKVEWYFERNSRES